METQSPVPLKQQKPEDGILGMTFYAALPYILEGKHITRIAWNNDEEYVFLGADKFIWIHTKGSDFTWSIHETDMIPNDWLVVKLKN